MNWVGLAAIILGSSWASGINLYLTIAALGISHRLEWIVLPGQLESISHPLIIILALILYIIEFVADKVPYVDSAWDSVHTFIRPVGGALLAYMAMDGAEPVFQTAIALASGTISLDSHLAKASTRMAINVSPEPVTNSIASVSEDAAVIGSIWLMIMHPLILVTLVILFIVLSIWLLPKMFRLLKKIGASFFGKKKGKSTQQTSKALSP